MLASFDDRTHQLVQKSINSRHKMSTPPRSKPKDLGALVAAFQVQVSEWFKVQKECAGIVSSLENTCGRLAVVRNCSQQRAGILAQTTLDLVQLRHAQSIERLHKALYTKLCDAALSTQTLKVLTLRCGDA